MSVAFFFFQAEDGIRDYKVTGVQTCALPISITRRFGVLDKARVPLRPHFGMLAVAPREAGLIDSIPPSYFGGNLDNWRAGKGATLFLPVSVPGALFSVGRSEERRVGKECRSRW